MIKIHIVSGFLGAGKTTLIKKLVKYITGKTVIIENEFGEVGIDGKSLESNDYDVVELSNGCICCSMKANFESTLLSVINEYSPENIIIEPTGIGMLSDILNLLSSKEIIDKCVVTLPITVVDALEYLDLINDFGNFYNDQISNAGIIVLSKTQKTNQSELEKVIKSIKGFNSYADIIKKDWDTFTEVEYNELTNSKFDLERKIVKIIDEIKNIKGGLQSYSTLSSKNFSYESLIEALSNLSNREYGDIIRAKGFVSDGNCTLEFSYVNGSYNVTKKSEEISNKICIIGEKLNKELLEKIFI